MTVLAAPSASVVGEIIDESTAFGAIKASFVIISKRPSDRDACGLRIFMIHNQGPHSARVPSPSGHAWMVLACGCARVRQTAASGHTCMVMALRPEASAPSARAVLAGSGGRSVATMAAEVPKWGPHLFRG